MLEVTSQIRPFTVPCLDWERSPNDFVQGELRVNQHFRSEITQEDLQNLIESQEQKRKKGGPWQDPSKMTPVTPLSGCLGLVWTRTQFQGQYEEVTIWIQQ